MSQETAARKHLVQPSYRNLEIQPDRISHWMAELAKVGVKPDELKRSIAMLEKIHQIRDADLVRQKEIADELKANSDVVLVVASPQLQTSARVLTSMQRTQVLKSESQVRFEPLYPDSRWTSALLQDLLRRGQRLSCVMMYRSDEMKNPAIKSLWENLRNGLYEILEVRHGGQEAERRLTFVCDDQPLLIKNPRFVAIPDGSMQDAGLFGPASFLPGFLCGVDSTQFVEGARSLCRSFEKAFASGDEPCRELAARQLHWIQDCEMEYFGIVSDQGQEPLFQWISRVARPVQQALGLGEMAINHALDVQNLAGRYGLNVFWEQDDAPGEFAGASNCFTSTPHIELNVRRRDPFSLGSLCAFWALSNALTLKILNLKA